jgi:hypothetical protein
MEGRRGPSHSALVAMSVGEWVPLWSQHKSCLSRPTCMTASLRLRRQASKVWRHAPKHPSIPRPPTSPAARAVSSLLRPLSLPPRPSRWAAARTSPPSSRRLWTAAVTACVEECGSARKESDGAVAGRQQHQRCTRWELYKCCQLMCCKAAALPDSLARPSVQLGLTTFHVSMMAFLGCQQLNACWQSSTISTLLPPSLHT